MSCYRDTNLHECAESVVIGDCVTPIVKVNVAIVIAAGRLAILSADCPMEPFGQ